MYTPRVEITIVQRRYDADECAPVKGKLHVPVIKADAKMRRDVLEGRKGGRGPRRPTRSESMKVSSNAALADHEAD